MVSFVVPTQWDVKLDLLTYFYDSLVPLEELLVNSTTVPSLMMSVETEAGY